MQSQDSARVGLCGWTIAMRTYIERFPLLEVQQTFYDPPAATLLERWRSSAPPSFEFTMKAWQVITHASGSPTYRRLKAPLPDVDRGQVGEFRSTSPVLRAWQRTVECARILRATAVLLQCPRSFRPTSDNVERMRTLLSSVHRPEARLLWEPRGDWPDDVVAELCRDLDLVHVVDPMQRETMTPEQTYYRLHGTTGARHVHTDDELRGLRDRISDRPRPYVLFNNLPRVGDAERFLRILRQP